MKTFILSALILGGLFGVVYSNEELWDRLTVYSEELSFQVEDFLRDMGIDF